MTLILGRVLADGTVVPVQVDANGVLQIGGSVMETPHVLLDGSINSDTVAGAPAAGDLVVGITQGGGGVKWQKLAVGAAGKVLQAQAAGVLDWHALTASDIAHALLDGVGNNDTVAGAPALGDIIVGITQGGGGVKWQKLAVGNQGQVLRVQSGGALAWEAAPYTLYLSLLVAASPADSQTYYFGMPVNAALTTTPALQIVHIPKSGRITGAHINCWTQTTLGSAENSTISVRLNNTTDILISNAVKFNASQTDYSNYALNQAVTQGDYIEAKWQTPAWVTNPTPVRIGIVVTLE